MELFVEDPEVDLDEPLCSVSHDGEGRGILGFGSCQSGNKKKVSAENTNSGIFYLPIPFARVGVLAREVSLPLEKAPLLLRRINQRLRGIADGPFLLLPAGGG